MLNQGHPTAESAEHLGDLASDGAATDDDCRCGDLVRRVKVLAGPERHGPDARYGGLAEPGAGRDDEVAPSDAQFTDGDDAGILDLPSGLEDADVLRLQALHRGRVILMAGNDVPASHRRGVRLGATIEDHGATGGTGRQRRTLDAVPQLGGCQHGLAGYAGEVGAFAAHQPRLHHGYPLTALGQQGRDVLTGRATAKDHGIVSIHDHLSRPGRPP